MNRFDVKSVALAPSNAGAPPEIHVTYNQDEKAIISVAPKAIMELAGITQQLAASMRPPAPAGHVEKQSDEKKKH